MLLLLLACPAEPDAGTDAVADADSGSGDPAAAVPTYYADVQPIMDRACARCHQVGLAADFSDPAYVAAIAPTIAAYVAEGRMPPAAPDPTCRDYSGSAQMTLTDAEKATIYAWAEGGAPLGEVADATSTPDIPTIAPFDLSLYAEAAYSPNFADVSNDYRCFALDVGNTEPIWVTGVEPIIGNPGIVHHLVLYQVDDDEELDLSPDGFACDGFGQHGWDFWVGWAPGGGPITMPEGTAMRLGTGQRLVLNMHYYGDAEKVGESDLSGYGFKYTTEEPEHAGIVYPLGVDNFVIPAGEAAHEEGMDFKWRDEYGTFHVQGVFPHMHLLGQQFTMTAGDDCVVDATPWDFHNQITAFFTEEVVIEGGDKVKLTCTWDNSADSPYQYNDPPQDVRFGEETTNEMCYAFTYGWFE